MTPLLVFVFRNVARKLCQADSRLGRSSWHVGKEVGPGNGQNVSTGTGNDENVSTGNGNDEKGADPESDGGRGETNHGTSVRTYFCLIVALKTISVILLQRFYLCT
jgi:hypothetical protein